MSPTPSPKPQAREPVAEETLAAHANRVLRARLTAAVVSVLDPAIALLRWCRKAAGAQEAEAGDGEHRPKSDRGGARPGDAAAPDAADAGRPPRRRLRAFLVYVSVLLAGGMGGGALAFELLENLVFYGYAENGRLEAALAAQSRSAAKARQEFAQAQASRLAAEKKLASLGAGPARTASDKRDRLAELAPRPERPRAADPAQSPRSVDCRKLAGNDVSALMDCIHEFNR